MLEHNERVRHKEIERKAKVKPHEIRLSESNRANSAFRRYRDKQLGKLGPASAGRIITRPPR
jgi:hypothetical protein